MVSYLIFCQGLIKSLNYSTWAQTLLSQLGSVLLHAFSTKLGLFSLCSVMITTYHHKWSTLDTQEWVLRAVTLHCMRITVSIPYSKYCDEDLLRFKQVQFSSWANETSARVWINKKNLFQLLASKILIFSLRSVNYIWYKKQTAWRCAFREFVVAFVTDTCVGVKQFSWCKEVMDYDLSLKGQSIN